MTATSYNVTYLLPEVKAGGIMLDKFGQNRNVRCDIRYDAPDPSNKRYPKQDGFLIRYDDKCCTTCKVAMKKGTYAAKWVPIDKSRSISAQLICFSCYGKSEGEKDPFDKLAREGFVFGGRRFQFIFGESTSSNTSKATGPGARGAVAAATEDDRFGITAFFFATRDEPDSGLKVTTVEEARQTLADFSDFPSKYPTHFHSKLNARIKLGYSPGLRSPFPTRVWCCSPTSSRQSRGWS